MCEDKASVAMKREPPAKNKMLALLTVCSSVLLGVLVDVDAVRQPELAAEGNLGLRWRCLQPTIETAIADALSTNFSGLGWSAALVQPLIGNLTGCLELHLDDLHGAASLPPLATALTAGCAVVGDENRPWEPARAAVPLRALDLEGSALGDAGTSALGPLLQGCGALETLHLPTNSIGDAGARALAAALVEPHHPRLRLLDLYGNRVRDYGADGLARLLRVPAPPEPPVPLVELRLHDNRIGAHGFAILADALRDNMQLRALLLSGNPGGDEGVAALARALSERHADRPSGLRRLHLSAVNMTDAGASTLLAALRTPHAPPLESLLLDGNPHVSEAALQALDELLAPNRAAATQAHTTEAGGAASLATGLFRAAERRPPKSL